MSKTNMSDENKAHTPHVVIVGGGAGGLELATRLGQQLGRKGRARITLIDTNRTHLWKPLLHQVAAGTLDSHLDEVGYLAQARRHHFSFRLGKMDGLDRTQKVVTLAPTLDENGEAITPRQHIPYDTLVLAIGSQSNDFNTPGVHEHAILLDSAEAAHRFHTRLINQCIRAQTTHPAAGNGQMTVAIIGGGATGVELAAELHTTTSILSSYGLEHIHPERDLKIVIIDAAPKILAALPAKISDPVARELRSLNIEIHCNERVSAVTAEGVEMHSGKKIPSQLVVWAAGIQAPPFLKTLDGLETNRLNQLQVRATLQTTLDDDIFAMGDCASYTPAGSERAIPPRAQAAHQMASHLLKAIKRRLKNKSLPTFVYRDFGSLVSLGEYSSVGSLMGGIIPSSVFIEGKFAQLVYWSLHKQHQIAINGLFRTILATAGEILGRIHRPRIKLH